MRNVVQLCLAPNNILLVRKLNHDFFPSCDRSCVKMADCFQSMGFLIKKKLGDRMTKQLLNSVIAKYRDLPVSRRSIICLIRNN